MLRHYQDFDGLEDEELLDEAIATCEAYFKNACEDSHLKNRLLHHSRPLAIAYLALKYEKSKKATE